MVGERPCSCHHGHRPGAGDAIRPDRPTRTWSPTATRSDVRRRRGSRATLTDVSAGPHQVRGAIFCRNLGAVERERILSVNSTKDDSVLLKPLQVQVLDSAATCLALATYTAQPGTGLEVT